MMEKPTDYCGGCGEPLVFTDNGCRVYCCAPSYWSEMQPLLKDQQGQFKLTGKTVPREGQLFYYRPMGITKENEWWV